ncbi:hypothetical protein O181_067841 [Austropuccinia psidii MF-1]|uniref:Uncharacterized protein n=1 Tax=Austropuccinia psidii MF-1 TaxID=1389203 RepID=A0A9Q3F0H3_9BASI|nr:hypothetical protein [Austropuccinia psidii MF-1]
MDSEAFLPEYSEKGTSTSNVFELTHTHLNRVGSFTLPSVLEAAPVKVIIENSYHYSCPIDSQGAEVPSPVCHIEKEQLTPEIVSFLLSQHPFPPPLSQP